MKFFVPLVALTVLLFLEKAGSMPLDVNWPELQAFCASKKEDVQPLKMVFGQVNHNFPEHRKAYYSEENFVFFDRFPHKSDGPPSIQGNFNDLNLLKTMTQMLPCVFDEIIVDHLTHKYLEWTDQHLACVKDMLKSGGQFIYSPEVFMMVNGSLSFGTQMPEEYMRTHFCQEPNMLPNSSLNLPYEDGIDCQEMERFFLHEVILPKSKAFLQKIFPEVDVQHKAPFPIPSQYGEQPLIMAKKSKE